MIIGDKLNRIDMKHVYKYKRGRVEISSDKPDAEMVKIMQRDNLLYWAYRLILLIITSLMYFIWD